jgi:PhnB protein
MLSPLLMVKDMEKTIEFYTQILGFENTFQLPDPEGNLVHANLVWKDVHIMLGPASPAVPPEAMPYRGSGVDFYILVEKEDDIDQYYAMLKEKGANIVQEITDQFWGDRNFVIKDPDGYQLTFAKTIREVSSEDMMAAMQQMA